MVKEPAAKRLAKARPAPKNRSTRKPGIRAKVKPDPKFARRMAELGISPIVAADAQLEMFLELQRQHAMGAVALLWDAAIVAMKAAAYKSDNLTDWIAAGRKAAGLGPRPKQ